MAKKVSVKKGTRKVSMSNVQFEVDFTDVNTLCEAYAAVAEAALCKYCTENEIEALTEVVRPTFYVCYCNCDCKPKAKKPNIFKRFWNWITRKK